MAIISRRNRFLFLPQPRTASKSVTAVLERDYDASQIGGYHKIPQSNSEKWGDLSDFWTFTIVRNPETRLRSVWNRGPWEQPFLQWLQWLDGMPVAGWRTADKRLSVALPLANRLHPFQRPLDQVIYYEDLQSGLSALPFAKENFPPPPQRPWQTSHPDLTEEERKIIHRVARLDFEVFYANV